MIDPRLLADLVAHHAPAALCTVIATKGSTPRKAGASMVVVDDGSDFGRVYGTVGGGALEHEIRRAALQAIAEMAPRLVDIPLTTVLGMCCGGSVTVFIESLRMRPRLLLFGAGHVAEAVCVVADKAGFDVTVVDPRDELRTAERFPAAVAFADSYDHDDDYRALVFAPDVFVVVATHDHAADQRIAEKLCGLDFAHAAIVGSQRKSLMMRERLRNKGIADDVIARLRCPAGLDIGAETPEEIAVSIVAEMVAVRRAALRTSTSSSASSSTSSTSSSTSSTSTQKESA